MPNTMPGNIAKGRFLSRVDQLVNTPQADRNTLRAELAAFTNGKPDHLLITENALVSPDCIVDKWIRPLYEPLDTQQRLRRWRRDRLHVYRHWLPKPPWKGKMGGEPEPGEGSMHGGWFEEHQPVARIVRAGLIHALDALANTTLEIDCYWLCAGSHFEVASLKSGVQLTVLFLTPSPPMTRRGINFKSGFEDIFISKHTSHNPGEQEVSAVVPHATTVQLARPR